MDVLYLGFGIILGGINSYFWFMVGRNTRYQDSNIAVPSSPAPNPTIASLHTKDKNKKPNPMLVNELDEHSIAALMEPSLRTYPGDE